MAMHKLAVRVVPCTCNIVPHSKPVVSTSRDNPVASEKAESRQADHPRVSHGDQTFTHTGPANLQFWLAEARKSMQICCMLLLQQTRPTVHCQSHRRADISPGATRPQHPDIKEPGMVVIAGG
jgi:hypothetical protein